LGNRQTKLIEQTELLKFVKVMG